MFSAILTLFSLLVVFVIVAIATHLTRRYHTISMATFAVIGFCVEAAYVILVSIAYFFKIY